MYAKSLVESECPHKDERMHNFLSAHKFEYRGSFPEVVLGDTHKWPKGRNTPKNRELHHYRKGDMGLNYYEGPKGYARYVQTSGSGLTGSNVMKRTSSNDSMMAHLTNYLRPGLKQQGE
jgi:hypothetical protein